MPICTTCAAYTPYLYTVYESAYNLRLEQCQGCHSFVDPYVEHDTLTLLLDLILLKRGVYRHLLYNRGTKPRREITDSKTKSEAELADVTHTSYLSRARRIWTLKLGAGLVTLDAFIRWAHLCPRLISESHEIWARDSLSMFTRVLLGCLAETFAFHTGILLACFIILNLLSLFNQLLSRFPSLKFTPKAETPIAREFKLSLVPLTLFYSSLTKLFLLFLLTIWAPASPTPSLLQPPAQSEIPADWLHELISDSKSTLLTILSEFSRILDDDKIDREWIIRNILGGMSAGFGLRVILDIHPAFSTLIIFSGWAAKTAVTQFVKDWVGGDTQMSQAWLAYSIP